VSDEINIGLPTNMLPRKTDPKKIEKDMERLPEYAQRYYSDYKKMQAANDAESLAWEELESWIKKNVRRPDGLALKLHTALMAYQEARRAMVAPATNLYSSTEMLFMMLGVTLEPFAREAKRQKKRMRNAQKIRTQEQSEQKRELDEFIRKQYRNMSQSLKSGDMQVKQVNAAIIDMVKARFTDDPGHGLVISQSRIDRAMGKKK